MKTANFEIKKITNFQIKKKNVFEKGELFVTKFENITYYLVKQTSTFLNDHYVYTVDPLIDGEKYIFFSLACLEILKIINWEPDVIHANDWHTAIAIRQLQKNKHLDFCKNTIGLQVIHNLPFLGAGTQTILDKYSINPQEESHNLPEWARRLPLPMSLVVADQIVTVSPSYAEEICTPSFGNGLEDFLEGNKKRIKGILNGIDVSVWNPVNDQFLHNQFSKEDLNDRKKNKEFIQKQLNLEISDKIPLLISISRLDPQKGIDLLLQVAEKLIGLDWQFILLGTGDKFLEKSCLDLQQRFPDQVRAIIRFDNQLAHQLFAAGDIFLMPSLYEPCGTSQMIAMRYGCIPVGSAVGGLKDSIDSTKRKRTGFLFSEINADAFYLCLSEALKIWKNNKEGWKKIQIQAMQKDFSWERSARKYLELYEKLINEMPR